MRVGKVLRRDRLAGLVVESDSGAFQFTYDPAYRDDPTLPPVSLTLPKRAESYHAPHLFPCFVALLAEGALAEAQCRQLRLDERDHFGRLLATTQVDGIGSLRIQAVSA